MNNQALYGEEDKPEIIREYDAETGEETKESIAGALSHSEEILLAECEALDLMRHTRGWKIIEEFLANVKAHHMERCILETNYDEIRRHQEFLKAYSNLEAFVEGKLNEGRRLKEERQQPTDPAFAG